MTISTRVLMLIMNAYSLLGLPSLKPQSCENKQHPTTDNIVYISKLYIYIYFDVYSILQMFIYIPEERLGLHAS